VEPVRELRVVLVMVPPLLADLIRHVVASRFEQWRGELSAGQSNAEPLGVALSIIAEVSDTPDIGELVRRTSPHVIIVGTAAAASLCAAVTLPSDVRVLRLSADLTRLYGPVADDSTDLTPDALADRLHDISKTI
jgi:hypothetical protein